MVCGSEGGIDGLWGASTASSSVDFSFVDLESALDLESRLFCCRGSRLLSSSPPPSGLSFWSLSLPPPAISPPPSPALPVFLRRLAFLTFPSSSTGLTALALAPPPPFPLLPFFFVAAGLCWPAGPAPVASPGAVVEAPQPGRTRRPPRRGTATGPPRPRRRRCGRRRRRRRPVLPGLLLRGAGSGPCPSYRRRRGPYRACRALLRKGAQEGCLLPWSSGPLLLCAFGCRMKGKEIRNRKNNRVVACSPAPKQPALYSPTSRRRKQLC